MIDLRPVGGPREGPHRHLVHPSDNKICERNYQGGGNLYLGLGLEVQKSDINPKVVYVLEVEHHQSDLALIVNMRTNQTEHCLLVSCQILLLLKLHIDHEADLEITGIDFQVVHVERETPKDPTGKRITKEHHVARVSPSPNIPEVAENLRIGG